MQDDEIYFKTYKWMYKRLGLKGAELQIYAIIYSFSNTGKPFTGSINWIGDFIGTNYKTVIKHLKSLTEKGYIIKENENANNGTANTYTVNPEFVYSPENTPVETIPALETPAEISTDNPQVNIIVEKFNEICTDLERVNKISPKTIEKIEKILKKGYAESDFEKCFKTVNASRFLRGQKNKFKAQFSWIVDPKNFETILSGRYTDMQAFEVAGLEHFEEDYEIFVNNYDAWNNSSTTKKEESADEYEELWNNYDAWDNSSTPKKEKEPGDPDITNDITDAEKEKFKIKMDAEVYTCKNEQEEQQMLEYVKNLSDQKYWGYFKQNYKLQYTNNIQYL